MGWTFPPNRVGRKRGREALAAPAILVSTTAEIPGWRLARHLGHVRGVTARSRSAAGNFAGGLQALFGGRLSAYARLAEAARQEAFERMCANARDAGANAVVGMRYAATEILDGITEVLAYGTAVWAEPLNAPAPKPPPDPRLDPDPSPLQ